MAYKIDMQFEKFVQDCLESFNTNREVPEELCREFEKQLRHIFPDNPYARSCALVPVAFKCLKPNASVEEFELAKILGWCYHLMQACANMFDDYVDNGELRYGRITWTKLKKHDPSIVLYDALHLESIGFYLLRKYFRHEEKRYIQLLELFMEAMQKAWKGYRWEAFQTYGKGDAALESYNWETYALLCDYKWGWLNSCLPLAAAMILAGFDRYKPENQKLYSNVQGVCKRIAKYLYVRDDYFDCFPKTSIDKSDSDIRRGQLTWPFLTAKDNCKNKEQESILLSNYGKENTESEIIVRKLYIELDIPKLYDQYIQDENLKLSLEIKELFASNKEVANMLQCLLDLIHEFHNL